MADADRVLVPYDGSPHADDALAFALERFPDATVTALYVIEIPGGSWTFLEGPEVRLPVSEKARAHATDVLENATEQTTEHEREVATEIGVGKPERRIVELARDERYDTIVIGSHGRTDISRVLLGSVAEQVVRESPVPVVVIR
ncbi:universal stress protein [Salinadaptatus halalkaliphilus]|uniref:Universal stress protein n=1 Tax=Salinadaptatus halalkaliphilus TaxID=2419781 RepID=A0A4S3TJN8_9EURY|nr:universal stress protein [Salinadaptatus halalkaliphilus]THE64309.1 universal stress protein [Salinadaptatus halalkaliphilus]